MINRKKMFSFSIIFILFVVLFTASFNFGKIVQVHGSDKVVFYQVYNVSFLLNMDGSLSVNETQVVVFDKGSFTHGFREIPFWGFDDIVDVKVYEIVNGRAVEYLPGRDSPRHFAVDKGIEWVEIHWWFDKVDVDLGKVVKVFRISYRLTHVVAVDLLRNRNVLPLTCFPSDHPVIKNAYVTLLIPSQIDLNELEIDPEPRSVVVNSDYTVFQYDVGYLYNDETFSVQLSFPKIFDVPLTPRKILQNYVRYFIVNFGLIAIFAPLIIVGVYSFSRKIRNKMAHVSKMEKEKVSKELDYVNYYVLRKEKRWSYSAWEILLITLLQLAKKGLVTFRKGSKNNVFIKLNENRGDSNLEVWEKAVYKTIYDRWGYGEVKFSKLIKRLYRRNVDKKVYVEVFNSLCEKGLISGEPIDGDTPNEGEDNLGFILSLMIVFLIPFSIGFVFYGQSVFFNVSFSMAFLIFLFTLYVFYKKRLFSQVKTYRTALGESVLSEAKILCVNT